MTNILICADWFYPAYKAGGPVQSIVNLVNSYQRSDIRFFIFCSNADLDGTLNSDVPFDQWHMYNAYTKVWYASPHTQTATVLKQQLIATEANLLFIIGMFTWYSNRLKIFFERTGVKTVISARGMLHPGALTQKSFKKKIYLALWKFTGLHKQYLFHATDKLEEQYIREVFGKKVQVFVAGNFPRVIAHQPAIDKINGVLHLISIALLGPMKNILLVLEALQECRSQVHYFIYGPVKDADYWQQCLDRIQQLPSNVTVKYHGDLVPDKIPVALQTADVFVLPSKSENFGHALYEALSAGKPIITSDFTPFNHLTQHNAGKNVSTRDTKELTAAIDFFAAMPADTFRSWNHGASQYATDFIDLDQLKKQYDQLFLSTIAD